MSFVNKLMSYVFNEVMVNALANSRAFQRFAVKSDALMKEAAKGDAAKMLRDGQEAVRARAEEMKRVVFEEISKGSGRAGS